MLFINKAKSMIQASDMFCSKQFFRYKTKNQYHTVTGGLVTLSVLITISISFATMVLQTLARTNIYFDTNTVKTSDPSLTTIVTGQNSKFMFGLRVMPQNQQSGNTNFMFNLSDSKRYFDITFIEATMQSGMFSGYKPIPLETCTKAHWSILPNIQKDYDKLQMDNWLCPPINTTFNLQGQYSSDLSNIGMITVTACNNYSNINNVQSVCATPDEITAYFANYTNILFGYLFSNPVLNPSQTTYIDYYLQTLSQAIFSQNIASVNLINYADYTITTDNSIWPFQDTHTDVGIIMDGNMQSRPLTKTPAYYTYLKMMLFKSTSSLTINRSVQKMSSTFSYIGGFFGAIATALFMLKIYTNQAFEVSIGKSIFLQKTEEKQGYFFSNFNIFKFLAVKGYELAKKFKIPVSWQKGEVVRQYQQQINRQLNVTFLLQRLINLQRMMTILLNQQQVRQLQLSKRVSIEKYKNIHQRLGYKNEDQELEDKPQNNQTNDALMKRNFVQMENCSHLSSIRQESVCQPIKTINNNLIIASMIKEDIDPGEIPVTYSYQNRQIYNKNLKPNLENQAKPIGNAAKQNIKAKQNLNLRIVSDLQMKDQFDAHQIIMDIENQKFN